MDHQNNNFDYIKSEETSGLPNNFNYIKPEEMPEFMIKIATEYFRNNPEIRFKLIQCSAYIHGVNAVYKKLFPSTQVL